MTKIQLQDGPQLSRLIYGTWRISDTNDASSYSPKNIHERIKHCLSLGITTFDLADIYGGGDHQCEKIFGAGLAIEPSLRSQIQLITKCDIQLVVPARPSTYVKHYDTSRDYILASVEGSLKAIGTGYVDILLLHRPDPLMNATEVAETMKQLKQEGKVKYFGVSNFSPSQVDLLQSRLTFPLVTNQIEAHVLRLDPLHDGTLDQCQRLRMAPMAWSPLAGGAIFNESNQEPRVVAVREALRKVAKQLNASVDQVAFAWLLKHPSNMLPIVGTNDLKRITSAAGALQLQLDRQQWFSIWEASAGHPVP